MSQDQTHPNNENNSDPYQNGQSDAEKLMRRHLQTPGDVITEDELKNLKITGADATAPASTSDDRDDSDISDRNGDEETRTGDETDERPQTTPWDVIA